VTVRGDRLTTHETVVLVLDACSLAGLSNLSVGTRDLGTER
jgi:biopolymer transport protein ExbD